MGGTTPLTLMIIGFDIIENGKPWEKPLEIYRKSLEIYRTSLDIYRKSMKNMVVVYQKNDGKTRGKAIGKWENHGRTMGKWRFTLWLYQQFAMENGHRNRGFLIQRGDFP